VKYRNKFIRAKFEGQKVDANHEANIMVEHNSSESNTSSKIYNDKPNHNKLLPQTINLVKKK
jgi:hypothetical protein